MAIISFKNNFIFVKTTKSGGTSIEVDLSPIAGKDAIVTRISPPVEGHKPRNFSKLWRRKDLYFNHMPATRIRHLLGRNKYESMLSFCVEREPVEKCISHYHMLRNSPLHNADGSYTSTWAEYVEMGKFPIDIDKYTEGAEGGRRLIVNRIIRYDALPNALTMLLSELGVNNFSLQTRAKSEYSKTRLIRPEEVTEDQRRKIYSAFAESIRVTGIDWGQSVQPN